MNGPEAAARTAASVTVFAAVVPDAASVSAALVSVEAAAATNPSSLSASLAPTIAFHSLSLPTTHHTAAVATHSGSILRTRARCQRSGRVLRSPLPSVHHHAKYAWRGRGRSREAPCTAGCNGVGQWHSLVRASGATSSESAAEGNTGTQTRGRKDRVVRTLAQRCSGMGQHTTTVQRCCRAHVPRDLHRRHRSSPSTCAGSQKKRSLKLEALSLFA